MEIRSSVLDMGAGTLLCFHQCCFIFFFGELHFVASLHLDRTIGLVLANEMQREVVCVSFPDGSGEKLLCESLVCMSPSMRNEEAAQVKIVEP